MGEVKFVESVKLFCGLIVRSEEWLLRAQGELFSLFGETDLESDMLPFDFTDYYREEMGEPLFRKFVSFPDLVDPGDLADIKVKTNAIERKLAERSSAGLRRRVNIDPGYVAASKVVLATTKDFSHRIYLHSGIYAEVTMNFRKDRLVCFDWTYPDYRSGRYSSFFLEVRRRYKAQLLSVAASGGDQHN